MFDWERHRNEDGTLDLQALFCSQFYDYENKGVEKVLYGPNSERFWKAYRKMGMAQKRWNVRSRRAAKKLIMKVTDHYGLVPA